MRNRTIVNSPQQLNVDWAQAILSKHEELTEVEINGVNVTSVDIGTTTRVRIAVEHNVPDVPKQWFVKLPSLSFRAKAITALPRLLPTEVRFYNELADQVPLNKPKLLFAHNRFGRGSTLVINDVSEFGAIPGRVGDALTVEQARSVIRQLAQFHAHFTNKARNGRDFRWLAGPVRRLEDGLGAALAVPLMRRGLRLAGEYVAAGLHGPALRYARHRKKVMRFLSSAEPTLVHHDCHPGNLFWHNNQPGFLDWQMVRVGEGIGDVSYFLATALTPESRRQHELALLAYYHEIMAENHSVKTDFNSLLNRYRAHLVYSFEAMIVTLAVGGMMPLDSNLEMIRRAAQAIEDHDAFALLQNVG